MEDNNIKDSHPQPGDVICVITHSETVIGILEYRDGQDLFIRNPTILQTLEDEPDKKGEGEQFVLSKLTTLTDLLIVNTANQLGWGPLRRDLIPIFFRFIQAQTQKQIQPLDQPDEWGDD